MRGRGEKWTGYHQKVRSFRSWLEEQPGDHLALFLDAYDTVLLCGETRLVEFFEAAQADVLISAETGLWPDVEEKIAALYPATSSPFRFVNSGVYMGRVEALRDFLAGAECFAWGAIDALGRRHHEADDQRLLTSLFLCQPGVARLDHEQRLCSNLFGCNAEQYRVSLEGVENRYTGASSCILHGNGAHGTGVLEVLLARMKGGTRAEAAATGIRRR